MVLTDSAKRPSLPLNEYAAATLGIAAANDLALRKLIELLDRENGKRCFQKTLYDALSNIQSSIEFEFKSWYGCRWAAEASNPDATTYKVLSASFESRIRDIQTIYLSLRP